MVKKDTHNLTINIFLKRFMMFFVIWRYFSKLQCPTCLPIRPQGPPLVLLKDHDQDFLNGDYVVLQENSYKSIFGSFVVIEVLYTFLCTPKLLNLYLIVMTIIQ